MKKINNGQLRKKDINKEVILKGWIANKRKLGNLIFIDLRDRWGITQLVLNNEKEILTKESVIEVKGKVVPRKDINKNIATGDIEIKVSDIKVLSKSKVTPFVIKDDLELKEENRLNYRFLDLRRNKMIKNLTLRHKFILEIRNFLDKNDFLEIETPILSKATPEGARDYLVPTRNEGNFFALPQSPQIFKQLLMASGIEKYFQIARCFRDEDLRSDRQPEFTQLDMEISFVDEKEIKTFIEKMLKEVLTNLGYKIKIPFKEMTYDIAINKYGSDKPDLRFGNELLEVTNYFKESNFNIFKEAINIKAIFFEKILSNKEVKILEEIALKNKAKGLFWGSYNSETQEKNGPAFKFINKEINAIFKDNKLSSGTILFVASKHKVTTQSLGAVRVKLNEMFNLAKQNELNFTWITNWPAFEFNEEENRYTSSHHPFTAPSKETSSNFDINPEKAKARAYDLVLNGFEIGGGSIRNNDLEIQKRIFNLIGMNQETIEEKFGFFLEAFKYGMPPHGGIAFGIDRIIAILNNENSIRDVIAFPKNTKGIDPLSKSPSKTTNKQLKEYGLKLK
ncbi:MAG: aspartate--tRNA ligase [Mycoplasma sp.]|nr:aspartate--tRNA ligase [Mycoplasma sp.]